MTAREIADQVRAWFMRPRIVHRLPGRLRLHVPALKLADPTQRDWVLLWRDLLDGVPEIQSVEATLESGNVLIRYHPEQLTEGELLDFLQALNRAVLRDWDRLAGTPPGEVPEAVRRLVAAIRPRMRRRLTLAAETGCSGNVSP